MRYVAKPGSLELAVYWHFARLAKTLPLQTRLLAYSSATAYIVIIPPSRSVEVENCHS
jgi:hypothetical protein